MTAFVHPENGVSPYTPSVLRCATRPNDLDSLAHVNNAVSLEYLEAGRWDWFSCNRLRRGGSVTPVVTRAEVDYLQQIFPGELEVYTQMLGDPGEVSYRAVFQQAIMVRDKNGRLVSAVQARISVAFLDMATQRLCSLQNFLEENRMPKMTGHLPAMEAAQ